MAGAVELSVNGAPATLEDLTHIALVNYGAYTSFRVEQGRVRGLDLHLARLGEEAVELFGEPVDQAHLRQLLRTAVSDRETCWLRVSLFSPHISPRNPDWEGQPQVLIAASASPPPLADRLRLQVQTYSRERPHLKHVGTFGLIRARREARAVGFDDALFADEQGRISEGTLWNIGFISGNEVIWPQAPMLAGVAQALVRRGLAFLGFTDRTAMINVDDLRNFDGAFICNSATPACVVSVIGDHSFNGQFSLIDRLEAAWASNLSEPI